MREPPDLPDFIGQSPAFQGALAHASAAATLDRPLLICGERGSGKELFAGRIHFLSSRWDGPFIKVNCAALSDDLLDSELFGHEPGAFTGAQKRHVGRFERANGGTLFLDEIPSASLRVQEKLLRVIEYGEFERLGGEATVRTDVRIVAAANIDLPALARRGAFRADLLDRLAFDVIYAPPLRERPDDIPLLAAHFASQMAREMGAVFAGFSPDAMAVLISHDWPGNVRELKNAAERTVFRWLANDNQGVIDAVSLTPFVNAALPATVAGNAGEIGPDARRDNNRASYASEFGAEGPDGLASRTMTKRDDAPAFPPAAPLLAGDTMDLRAELDKWERTAASAALASVDGNQKAAAKRLGLTYDQMRGIIRKHDLA